MSATRRLEEREVTWATDGGGSTLSRPQPTVRSTLTQDQGADAASVPCAHAVSAHRYTSHWSTDRRQLGGETMVFSEWRWKCMSVSETFDLSHIS